jgi:prevent-host-death family protein
MELGKVDMLMGKEVIIPDNHQMTEFLRGKASQIFDEVTEKDTVVMVNKNSKPQNVVISYDRYCRLKKNGADI